MKKQLVAFMVICFMLPSLGFCKTDEAAISLEIIEVISPKLFLYSSADGPKEAEQMKADVLVPLRILEETPMRLKVELIGKQVWIRQNQVRTNRKKEIKSDCSTSNVSAKGKAVMATRGLGEGCQ